jgi:hypothetical protein
MKKIVFKIFLLLAISLVSAETPFILTETPLAIYNEDSSITIKWTGAGSISAPTNPTTGTIYFSREPGGEVLSNYSDSVDYLVIDNELELGVIPQRKISFIPTAQSNMQNGIYYAVVGRKADGGEVLSNLYSSMFQIIVDANTGPQMIDPSGDTIDNVTPQFSWHGVPNVPYYHIIVSDEKIEVDLDKEEISGLSIVWQAITSGTQLNYGAPDPSQTITAAPIPLSAGKTYSWFVLSNYKNNAAFSSSKMSPPRSFTLAGESMVLPTSVAPASGSSLDNISNSQVTFSWTTLDSRANTYKFYLYTTYDNDGIEAKISVLDREIVNDTTKETLSLTLPLGELLTTGDYTWKVVAIDDRGAGQAGDVFTFDYTSPTGEISIHTQEEVTVNGNTISQSVGFAEIESEVVGGSLAEPIVSFTDDDGELTESRPEGVVRLTASRDGFNSVTKTVEIVRNTTQAVIFNLTRPDATAYGQIIDGEGVGIDLATVRAVSDQGDTVAAQSDPNGNFSLNLYEDGWLFTAFNSGYNSVGAPVRAVLKTGENYNFTESFKLNRMDFTLSGKIINSSGIPISMAQVKLRNSGGVVIDEITQTTSDGFYSFSVNSGVYTIEATKTGFSSTPLSDTVVQSLNRDITLMPNASVMNGVIYGRSFNSNNVETFTAITGATVFILNSDGSDILGQTVSDATWGNFTVSAAMGAGPFLIRYIADGYLSGESAVTTLPASFNDTIDALATISGVVKDTLAISANGVTISLIDGNSNSVATNSSDIDGKFEIRGVLDGDYTLMAAGNKLAYKSIIVTSFNGSVSTSPLLYVRSSRFYTSSTLFDQSTLVQKVDLTVEQGSGIVAWSATVRGGIVDDSATVRINSPYIETKKSGENFEYTPYTTFTVSINATDKTIIDCSTYRYTLTAENSPAVTVVNLPFTHNLLPASPDSSTGKITLSVQDVTGASVLTSARIYHKYPSIDNFSVDTLTTSVSGKYSFTFKPEKSGDFLEYYFELVATDGTIFSNEKEVFRTFVLANASMVSKLQLSPVADTLIIPLEGKLNLELNGFYGGNYEKVTDFTPSNVNWSSVGVSITAGVGATAVITGNTATDSGFVVAVFKNSNGYTLDPSILNDTIRIPIKVLSTKLSSMKVVRTSSHGTDLFVSNREKLEFGIEAYDGDKNRVMVTPNWSVYPEDAGIIISGAYSPDTTFMGRVGVVASLSDELQVQYLVDERPGQLISAKIDTTKGALKNGFGFTLAYPDSSVISGKSISMTVDKVIVTNKVAKTVGQQGVSLASPIYRLKRESGAVKFRSDSVTVPGSSLGRADGDTTIVPQDLVIASIQIPEEYEQFIKGDAKDFNIGVWSDSLLTWAYHWWKDSTISDSLTPDFDSTWPRYDEESRSLLFPVGATVNTDSAAATYALLYKEIGDIEAKVRISPNPFSPYVSPVADYNFLPDMNSDVKGTCIKIRSFNSTTGTLPDVNVDIYTARGELVWNAILSSVLTGPYYYLFWDGRVRLSRNSITDLEENTPLITKGQDMCRNGRYFVVTTFDDGKKKKRITKEVILFK